jgi:BirA family transcriptional regulator, biotin operon repressor / biotin---[acetyl-CoA-carboxylase] ligase
LIVGIGANLGAHPEGIERPTTSLSALGAAHVTPLMFGETLAPLFTVWRDKWRQEGLDPIRHAWLARAHAIGTALSASLPDGERLNGAFDGLTSDCALRLRLADGAVRVIHAGDIFLV